MKRCQRDVCVFRYSEGDVQAGHAPLGETDVCVFHREDRRGKLHRVYLQALRVSAATLLFVRLRALVATSPLTERPELKSWSAKRLRVWRTARQRTGTDIKTNFFFCTRGKDAHVCRRRLPSPDRPAASEIRHFNLKYKYPTSLSVSLGKQDSRKDRDTLQ